MGVLHTSVLNNCGFFFFQAEYKHQSSISTHISPQQKSFILWNAFYEQPKRKSLLDYSTFHIAWKNLELCRYAMPFFCIPTPLSHYNEELVHQFYQIKANWPKVEANCTPKMSVVI